MSKKSRRIRPGRAMFAKLLQLAGKMDRGLLTKIASRNGVLTGAVKSSIASRFDHLNDRAWSPRAYLGARMPHQGHRERARRASRGTSP